MTDVNDAIVPARDERYRDAANERWGRGDIQIDDDAALSVGDCGAWVQAWVWVTDVQAGIECKPISE